MKGFIIGLIAGMVCMIWMCCVSLHEDNLKIIARLDLITEKLK